jgi:voltage-gated potassium channel
LAIITLVSVGAVALETVTALTAYYPIFIAVEYIAVGIFTVEYVTRVALAEKPLRYVFSFFGLIDLIAILPSYLGLANLTFLKAARAVRIIRLLRILRLAKFAQIKRRKNAAQSLYTLNLEIYFFTLTFVTLILGTLFYLFEQTHAESIPGGMYWTLRAILGGITYPQPETIAGTVTLILARFTSMILLGMLLGLVGVMVRKLLATHWIGKRCIATKQLCPSAT